MGIEVPSSRDNIVGSPTPPSGIKWPSYSTSQFYKLYDAEPYSIERTPIDNPPFLFPPKEVPDFNGGMYSVQRGYMRSLISDPEVDNTKAMKNRRLFFQFNPQYLVRSVAQTPGTMNPLLQDPAQLMQPVPGTTSFGFELMFNREHEVNTRHNDANTEWLTLPNGDTALVSEIGVLADLLILDSITGQGISEDMINAVIHRSKLAYANKNAITESEINALTEAGDEETANKLKAELLEVPKDEEMSKLFTSNIGNSAFLNPQPFRVLFSTLFMVEGVATQVEVRFTKFSRTMIPTQCTVTINMYALYLGFAKKDTFIYSNLIQAAQTQEEDEQTDSEVRNRLNTAIKSAQGRLVTNTGIGLIQLPDGTFVKDFREKPDLDSPSFEVTDILKNRFFTEFLKGDTVTEANFSFVLQYYFSPDNTTYVTEEMLERNQADLLQDGTKINFNAKGTINVKGLIPMLNGKSIFQNEVIGINQSNPYGRVLNPWISFRIIMYVKAFSSTGSEVRSEIQGADGNFKPVHVFSTVRNYNWVEEVTGGKSISSSMVKTLTIPRSNSRLDAEMGIPFRNPRRSTNP